MKGFLVKYETYDEPPEVVEEKLWFHISKREFMEMQIADEPMLDVIEKIIASKSNQQIFNYMKEIILKSYGIRTADPNTGKTTKFKKSDEISKDFEDSAAFNAFIEDLITGDVAGKLADFINGILPTDITSSPEYQRAMADVKTQAAAEAAAEAAKTAPVVEASSPESRQAST